MYVSVIILFMTISLKYSTEVPCATAGLPLSGAFEATESECIDCTSQSRFMGVVDIGVPDTALNPPGPTLLIPIPEL
jgi:hypothetical protein